MFQHPEEYSFRCSGQDPDSDMLFCSESDGMAVRGVGEGGGSWAVNMGEVE